ncbi:MAG TPA: gliding motility-associated C-terminal domain-containing protein, partial [Hanamia sp.]|nr:gliding motility-associated C-terminal domain-containing protein [Hanamia sp.]
TLKLFPQTTTLFTVSGERFLGCTLSDTLLIKVTDCPVYIYFPNAFTPNRDGINDIFKPSVSGKIEQYRLDVYNRYGRLVFSSEDTNQGWNGSLKGNLQDPGIFIWYCRYKMKNEAVKSQKGSVTLIR